MIEKPRKRFDKLSYQALALYVAVMVVLGLAVYGINATSLSMDQSRSARAQVQSGRMVIVTEDRTQCRTLSFNNETAELSHETLIDCDPKLGVDSGSSFSAISNGFMKR